jgi:hypothetical protein
MEDADRGGKLKPDVARANEHLYHVERECDAHRHENDGVRFAPQGADHQADDHQANEAREKAVRVVDKRQLN